MAEKLATPSLPALSGDDGENNDQRPPQIRGTPRKGRPQVAGLVSQGFVAEAPTPAKPADPDDEMDRVTLMMPRRVKMALLEEVNRRRSDPKKRSLASLKSVVLEALAKDGFDYVISAEDIQSNSGVYLKRQAAATRKASREQE